MGHSANRVLLRKMMKSFIILNILVSVYVGGQSSRPPRPTTEDMEWECCPWKVVGNKKYWLVGQSDDAWDYGCSSDCTYMTEYSDVKYCFKPGSLPSECYWDGEGSKPPMSGSPGSRPPRPPTTPGNRNTGAPGGNVTTRQKIMDDIVGSWRLFRDSKNGLWCDSMWLADYQEPCGANNNFYSSAGTGMGLV